MSDEIGFPVRKFQLGVAWVALLNTCYCLVLSAINFNLTSFLMLLPICLLSITLFILTLKNKKQALYIGLIFFGLQLVKIISKPFSYELNFFPSLGLGVTTELTITLPIHLYGFRAQFYLNKAGIQESIYVIKLIPLFFLFLYFLFLKNSRKE